MTPDVTGGNFAFILNLLPMHCMQAVCMVGNIVVFPKTFCFRKQRVIYSSPNFRPCMLSVITHIDLPGPTFLCQKSKGTCL